MRKAQIISINMGYGHQRTAFALRHLAPEGKIINANDYPEIPKLDREIWERTRNFYEFISNFKRTPIIGSLVFTVFDAFQRIFSFYPKRDLSKPNFTIKNIYSLLRKGWGRDLIERLGNSSLPLISTFFTPAYMAEFFNYRGDIFCVVCDADISRTWAPLEPKKSRIKYFAPTERVVERLKLYGVRSENIFLTGYPLPLENLGDEKLGILEEDLKQRILNLDPQKKYRDKYKILIKNNLGSLPEGSGHPLTLMFAVGGAGAQKEIGIKIIESLRKKIQSRQIKIILVAGIRQEVKEYFVDNIRKAGLERALNDNINIVFAENVEKYFLSFNQLLRKTDILWTKPSELSFYAALGLPIVVSSTIGSQEEFNKRWLLKSGFGLFQEDPTYTNQWLFDWLGKGYLAKAALQGFIEGEKLGTLNIQKIISK